MRGGASEVRVTFEIWETPANHPSSKYVQNASARDQAVPRPTDPSDIENPPMLRRVSPLMRSELGDWARPFPTLDRAFDAVERTLARYLPKVAALPIAHRWTGTLGSLRLGLSLRSIGSSAMLPEDIFGTR